MAVVWYRRRLDGSSLSGRYGEPFVVTEKWLVRVDSPLTSKVAIINAVLPAHYGTEHPEVPGLYAQEVTASPEDADGMLWSVGVTFTIAAKRPEPNGLPPDEWKLSGSTVMVPLVEDILKNAITNAAGDPLEGLEKERDEQQWTLTKIFETDAELQSHRDAYAGRLNEGAWAGGASKTWKCTFQGASKKTLQAFKGGDDGDVLEYIESSWEFRYDPTTWKSLPWDIGMMELVSGKRQAIKDSSGAAVKQPVALLPTGAAAPAGTKPTIANYGSGFNIYLSADFAAGFGEPELVKPKPTVP